MFAIICIMHCKLSLIYFECFSFSQQQIKLRMHPVCLTCFRLNLLSNGKAEPVLQFHSSSHNKLQHVPAQYRLITLFSFFQMFSHFFNDFFILSVWCHASIMRNKMWKSVCMCNMLFSTGRTT